MRWALATVLLLHGLIHLFGFAKAFGYAELPQLTQPISRGWGVGWLLAAVLTVLAAGAVAAQARWSWVPAALALLASQVVLSSSWVDAKFGTLPNVVLLAVAAYGFAANGPVGLRSRYTQDAAALQAQVPSHTPLVTDADLAPLPAPVQAYLRFTGSVGQPRVAAFRAVWNGRIRGGADEAWMGFSAQQLNQVLGEPERLFLMDATMKHLPVDVLHRFVGPHATYEARVLSAVPVVHGEGAELDVAETVTLFNDLCILSPSALVEPAFRFESIDARSVRAFFTRGLHTVSAELKFDERGALVDFVSDDRRRASPDGKHFVQQRWSTPLTDYRHFGALRLAAHGEARWHDPAGAFTYGEFDLIALEPLLGTPLRGAALAGP